MNLSASGMLSTFKQDVVSRQLSRTASSGGLTYDPTSSAQKSNHETDKQAEENATWFFEYKALLNSKLTTLTTSLTSAYTTDLDASMTMQIYGGNKNSMQGITGQQNASGTIIDPGAARTAASYFSKYYGNPANIILAVGIAPEVYGTSTTKAETRNLTFNFASNPNAALGIPTITPQNGQVAGTTTFISGSNIALDNLKIDTLDPKNNDFVNTKGTSVLTGTNYPDTITPGKQISNNFELTLYKFFSKSENYDLLRFGLVDNIYVVGTSSLATGSQVQGSLSIKYNVEGSYLSINQERFSAFFSS